MLDVYINQEMRSRQRAIIALAQFKLAFKRGDYKKAREFADKHIDNSFESELRAASYICSYAFDRFMELARNGDRREAEKIARIFNWYDFKYWLPQH